MSTRVWFLSATSSNNTRHISTQISKTIKAIRLSPSLKAMYFRQSSTRVNPIRLQPAILAPTPIAALRVIWLILFEGSFPSAHRHVLSGDVSIVSLISFLMTRSSWMSVRALTAMLGLGLAHAVAIFLLKRIKSKFVRLNDSFPAPIRNSLKSSNLKWALLLRISTLSVRDVLKRVSTQLNLLLKPSTLCHLIGLTLM